ncbi:hypothetical protein [Streptomyces sp. NPDC048266]|uniref:hypothetical protein n=1 Tax=Streptomyces sp. NPDC048266 TaxID=3155787 RepID=UPI0033E74C24
MQLTEQHVVGRAAQQRKELGDGSAATRLGEFGKLGKLGEWLVGGAVMSRCRPGAARSMLFSPWPAPSMLRGPVRSRTLDIDATRLA